MRISDWSSDVCSSDLPGNLFRLFRIAGFDRRNAARDIQDKRGDVDAANRRRLGGSWPHLDDPVGACQDAVTQDVIYIDTSSQAREGKEYDSPCRFSWPTVHK